MDRWAWFVLGASAVLERPVGAVSVPVSRSVGKEYVNFGR